MIIIYFLFIIFNFSESYDSNKNLTYNVAEESSIGTFIGNALKDSGEDIKNVKFDVTPIHENLVRVDPNNGDLFVAKIIDRELICPQISSFLEDAQDSDCQIQFSIHISKLWINIYINILDINDNSPQFGELSETIRINEEADLNKPFPIKYAVDVDVGMNTIQAYKLSGDQEFLDTFALSYKLPEEVNLILLKKLDAEYVQEYEGMITACDRGFSGGRCKSKNLTIIVEDANDNGPIFEKDLIEIELNETTNINTPVVKVKAIDIDQGNNGKLTYLMKPNSVHQSANRVQTFQIDPNTGDVYLKSRLDAKERQLYKFIIHASDNGENVRTSSCNLIIRILDENDHKPWVKRMKDRIDLSTDQNTFWFKENLPKKSTIDFLAVGDDDLDENGIVNCIITEGSEYFSFSLSNPSMNLYTITNEVVFDREKLLNNGVIPLTIKCTDSGIPQLTSLYNYKVQIEDVNEHRPYYKNDLRTVELHIEENLPKDTLVFKSEAFDDDATKNIVYQTGSEPKNLFRINNKTGEIYVNGKIDREEQESVTFTIYACEEGQEIHEVDPKAIQSITVIFLDMNDNPPKLTDLKEFTIPENQVGYSTILGKISVYDPDNGNNGTTRFKVTKIIPEGPSRISPDEARKRFEVDGTTGEIKCTQKLDREEVDVYLIRLEMYDIGIPSMINQGEVRIIVTDLNDNAPQFQSPSTVPHISFLSNENMEKWMQKYQTRLKEPLKNVHELGIFNATAIILPGQKILQLFAYDRDVEENANLTFNFVNVNRLDKMDGGILSAYNVDTQDVRNIEHFYMSFFNLDPKTGELFANSGPDTKGITFGGAFEMLFSVRDNGHPFHEVQGRLFLQIMPPVESTNGYFAYSQMFISSSLSFNLIIVMISLTCLVSLCLLVAIFIVRKNATKESILHGHHIGNLQNGIIANKIENEYIPGTDLSTVHKWAQDGIYIQKDATMNGYLSPISLKTGYSTTTSGFGDVGHYEFGKQSNFNSNSSGSDNGVYFNINSPLIQQFPNNGNIRNSDSPTAQNLRSFY